MKAGTLNVNVSPNRGELGVRAGKAAAVAIQKAITEKGSARVIFAAAPSQNETLANLVMYPDIDWSKVTGLHMDEYIGLPVDSEARFSWYLRMHCFELLPFKQVFLLDEGDGKSPEELCRRYDSLLKEGPVDVVCMGIGENGHIAFNDPPVADFNDPLSVKIVDLDDICRNQQVNDGCFPDFDSVPKQAISLTIPTLMAAGCLICAVPGERKRNAVMETLNGPIGTACPATILRTHPNATLFVDTDSCTLEPTR